MQTQYDRGQWKAQTEFLSDIFQENSQSYWTELFSGLDACVAPILNPEEAESDPLPQCDLALSRVYNILDRMSEADVRKSISAKAKASLEEAHDDDDDAEAHALEQSSQINGAMKLTADLWKRTSVEWPEAAGDTSLGYDADSLKALQTRQKQHEEKLYKIAYRSRSSL